MYLCKTELFEMEQFLCIKIDLALNDLQRFKPAESYVSGIHKLPDKWQEVIQNNSEYTVHWH